MIQYSILVGNKKLQREGGNKVKFFAGIGIVVSVVGLIALSALINGLVLSVMWDWFMVPLGLPSISVALAIGVSLVAGFLTHQVIREAEDDRSAGEKFAYQMMMAFLRPGIVILFGWLVHFFV